jgi:Zn-dependent protease with chaperone function
MAPVRATYFDGRSARIHAVTLDIADGTASVAGDGVDRRESIASIEISDALGDAPRVLRFRDGAVCEVRDVNALGRLLAAHGIAPTTAVSQWEGSVRWIASGVIVFVVVLLLAYWYGVPFAARALAERIPAVAVRRLSDDTLAVLDRELLVATALAEPRRTAIHRAFADLNLPAPEGTEYSLVFRKSDALGANAFALPSGTIVVTDGLVGLARDDREILGVLAHEAGHVVRRHGLRSVLQDSIVGLAVAWFIGDVSALAAAAPTALIQASYSRDLEREADAYAVDVLRANRIPVRHLADILRRLEEESGALGTSGVLGYLSSHPATPERLQRLETSAAL